MWRGIFFAAALLVVSAAWAQEGKDKPAGATAEKSAAEKVRDNPNDAQALNALASERLSEIAGLMESKPDDALAKLKEFETLVAGLKSDSPAAKTLVGRIQLAIGQYREQVELAQIPLADLEKKIVESPDDSEALQRYQTKVMMQVAPLTRSEPEEASKQLETVKAALAKVKETAKEDGTKRQVTAFERTLAALDNAIEAGRKMAAIIGKDAAPLAVEAWVNGSPLTDDDLKGKVVLLDFWAIWCGPCIATFPHLREWQEKYADKGLVTIGLTRYYEFAWNEDDKRPAKVAGTSHEAEQEMLVKFAEHHGLKHRFGIQGANDMSEFYGVTGIPHVVVIDQQGKVRMMRVGSGDKNAQDIGGLLAELLEKKATGE